METQIQNSIQKYFDILEDLKVIDKTINRIAVSSYSMDTNKSIERITGLIFSKQKKLEEKEEYQKKFNRLDKRMKIITYLRYHKKMTLHEICAYTKLSFSTIVRCFNRLNESEGIPVAKSFVRYKPIKDQEMAM